ncbi:hypothetical protein BD410DRAFT_511416 [Rickenella mellea]|uniref:Ricin B lectin domain-containing protein n=1 Tax=Rickenella mellea TaxID=50990 RepID=A0A4Y7PT11_9AGAM|nr:hypothetical protein BD410DRAFT_511416 [Rickenella mellea]
MCAERLAHSLEVTLRVVSSCLTWCGACSLRSFTQSSPATISLSCNASHLAVSPMSTTLRHHNFQNMQCSFLPTGSYFITNVRHDVSVALPPHQDKLCGSHSNFKWKIVNDSDKMWYIQGGAGPWFAHRRPAPRAGNPIVASQERFGWVIGQCHAIRDPDCYLIYANSDHTLLWGLEDGENETPVTFCTGENNRRNWWRFKRIPDEVPDDGEDQIGVKPSLTLPVHDPLPRYVM